MVRKILSAFPQTQALESTTFRPPPLDGSLTLPELFDWHGKHTPDHRLFVFPDEDGSLRVIRWPEAVQAIHVGAQIIRDLLSHQPDSGRVPVVGILSQSDTIPYFIMEMSIMRANYVVFPISPRNSPAAVAHLIYETDIKHLLIGKEQGMINLANESISILRNQYPSANVPEQSSMPLFEDLFFPNAHDGVEDIPCEFRGSDQPAMILHSSGSTAFPKPITFTVHRLLQICVTPYFGERDLTDQVFSLHVMPMFHGMGVSMMCWAASAGIVLSTFKPKCPTIMPTPAALFDSAKATDSNVIFCVPAFVEAWSRKQEYVQWLATRWGVLYGGGPLNKQVGDYMTSQGVSVFILYGSTEAAVISPILPAQVGYDWEYFKFPEFINAKMVPYSNDSHELILVESEFLRPSVINTAVDENDAYATSDLLSPHPSRPGYWRIFGRTDDQIMHSTGEKTNPVPLESMLNQDPHVASSVMFGRGQFQAGVLIDPKPAFKFDPIYESRLAEFRNKIWPTIEKMNAFAPQHSRIFKEMIIVSQPAKPFTYTAKGTARRQAVINDYAEEILRLYSRVEETTQSAISSPTHWDVISTTDFVRAVVSSVLAHSVNDTEDLFQHGCDSLQATWIRNSLLRALRDSAHLETRSVTDNFVYSNPSILQLADYIFSIASGTEGSLHSTMEARIAAMRAMATKYHATSPGPKESIATVSDRESGDVVFLTGSTGFLGSYILHSLITDSHVSRVFALNRPSSRQRKTLLERQRHSFEQAGLDPSRLDTQKIVLLEANLTIEKLGVSNELFEEMHRSITHIIHNAWRVDFNLTLQSFESNIHGLQSLINFALTSPHGVPRFTYTSSMGVFRNVSYEEPQTESQIPPNVAAGSGYSESKWVSEEILQDASLNTPLKPVIVRVCQLCGSSNGAWNAREWFPSMVQSASIVGCFPSDERAIDWLPLDTAAAAIIDITRLCKTDIVHLANPRPIPWNFVASIVSSELSVPIVHYNEWLTKVEDLSKRQTSHDLSQSGHINALRILPFFQGIASQEGPLALGFPALENINAAESSPTMSTSSLPHIDSTYVKRWLIYWRNVGLISSVGVAA